MPRTYPAVGAPCRIPAANAFPRRSGFQHVPRGAFHRLCSARCQPDRARMPAASGLECCPRFLDYRRSYRLLRHLCGVPADVGWRWIGRAVASRLTCACWRWHHATGAARCDFRPSCNGCPGVWSQRCLQMRGVLLRTAFGLPPPHLLAVMG